MATNTKPADVQRSLSGVNYPAGKSDLIQAARKNSAPKEVVDALGNLSDKQYASADEVAAALNEA